MPATVIFLNGVSSAGKTSIAKVLQRLLPEPYLHVPLDSFEAMLPERYDESESFDGIYDIEVDTSRASAPECAQQMMVYLSQHEPNAFEQLRASR